MEFSLGPFLPVAAGVYVAVAEPASVNIGLVVGNNSALVIDTGSSPSQGRQIRTHAEQVAGVPVGHVLVTHWHWDHYFGLPGFGAPGAVSYGHETLASWLSHPELEKEARKLG